MLNAKPMAIIKNNFKKQTMRRVYKQYSRRKVNQTLKIEILRELSDRQWQTAKCEAIPASNHFILNRVESV